MEVGLADLTRGIPDFHEMEWINTLAAPTTGPMDDSLPEAGSLVSRS